MGYLYFVETSASNSATQDSQYKKTARRTFSVIVDSPSYDPIYAASHPALPAVWSVYPTDPSLFLIKLSCDRDSDNPSLFKVTAEYNYWLDAVSAAIDAQQSGQPPEDREANPLLRPRDYSVTTTNRPWSTYTAWNLTTNVYDVPILNSAGDPYLPPEERPRGGCTISIGLNSVTPLSSFWLSAAGDNCLNENAMIIGPYHFDVGQVMLSNASEQLIYEYGISYWRWTLNFEYRDTWQRDLIDQGKRQLYTNPATGIESLVPILDPVTGQSVSQSVLLDGSGRQLPPGGSPSYNTYHLLPRIVFPSPM